MERYQTVKAGISVGAGLHNVLREKKGYHSVVRIKRQKAVILWFRTMPHLVGSSEHLNNFCRNRLLKSRILENWTQNFSTKCHFCWNGEKQYIFLVYVCSRNCIIIIIIITIVNIIIILSFFLNIWRDVVYFVYCYNCVPCCCGDISKSPGDCNFFGLLLVHWGLPQNSQLLEFLQDLEEDGCGMRWRVIAILLLKMYVRGWYVKSRWDTSVNAHEGRYFV